MSAFGLPSGLARNIPGLIWFLERESAPAWKWQEAHDTPPPFIEDGAPQALSLPSCWSQNRAFPKRIAASLSLMKSVRLEGSAIGTVRREAKGPVPCAEATCSGITPVMRDHVAKIAPAKITAIFTLTIN